MRGWQRQRGHLRIGDELNQRTGRLEAAEDELARGLDDGVAAFRAWRQQATPIARLHPAFSLKTDSPRVLFYTGIRVGELLTLRWADVDLGERLMLVRRNLSAGVETEPKGRRHRYVPLSDPALTALARLGSRNEFVDPDDYVVCNRWGRRLDASALRRRYHLACGAARLRRVKLHGLRHAAGNILARTADPVFVRDYLGHAKLSTTDRCERQTSPRGS